MQIADELCKYIDVCGLSRLRAESVDSVHYVHVECEVDSEQTKQSDLGVGKHLWIQKKHKILFGGKL